MTDITGLKFNRWLVLSRAETKRNFYLCRCECGAERQVRGDQLTRGASKSCGCWKAEVSRAQIKRLFTKHGQANKSRTYGIWKGIRKRCMSPECRSYMTYGARGITICDRWNDYANFLADMGEAPDGMSIDRIDNNKGYEPSNCRWADKFTQMNNMRSNVLLRYKGETLTVKQWARKLDMPYSMLYQRLFRLSWPIEKALTTPRKINGGTYA